MQNIFVPDLLMVLSTFKLISAKSDVLFSRDMNWNGFVTIVVFNLATLRIWYIIIDR